MPPHMPQQMPPQFPPQMSKPKKSKKPKEDFSNLTSIEELETEEDEDEEEIVLKKPKKNKNKNVEQQPAIGFKNKPVSVRSGPGNYELSDDYGEFSEERQVNANINKAIKQTDNIGGKKSDLMSSALAMQKSREIEDSKTPTIGMPPPQSFQDR